MKKRFLCDVDGVVADFVKAAVKVMTDLSGKDILPEHVLEWEVTHVLEDESHRSAAKAEFMKAGFCEAFEAYDGSVEAIDILRQKTDFYFVTVPMVKNPGWFNERQEWLSRHFKIEHERVNFVHNKFIVSGDFLLDDAEKNTGPWVQHHPNGTGILWDRPWNRSDKTERVVRAHSWNDVIQAVEERSLCGE